MLGGVLISVGCSEDYLYLFLFSVFRYIYSCTWVLWPLLTYIVLIFFICWYIFLSPILAYVVSFLSLYTWFLLLVCNLLFLFHTKMPWWVLFKVFQNLQSFSRVCVRIDFILFNKWIWVEWVMTTLICSFVCYGFVTNCQRGRLLGYMWFTC